MVDWAFSMIVICVLKHQGVSETPKYADVICEQPLSKDDGMMMMMTPEEILRIRDGVGEEVPPGQGDDGVLPGNRCVMLHNLRSCFWFIHMLFHA